MRLVSLDTPNEVLWARDSSRETAKLMRELPTPANERTLKDVVRTRNGNVVKKRGL